MRLLLGSVGLILVSCLFLSVPLLQVEYNWTGLNVKLLAGCSVADPDPGYGTFLTPGSGILNRFFPDLESRIPNPYFWELSDNFLGKKFYNSLKTGPNFFLQHFKTTMGNFSILWNFWLHKKVWQEIYFRPSLLLLFLDPGSGMGKNQDPGSGINIPDPQHWPVKSYYSKSA